MEKPFEEIIKNFTSSGDARLDAILKFTAEADQMTAILRRTILTDGSRRENDAEHSWHIALMAMLFKDYAEQTPNVERAVKMCVVHDLIEIYAGDTFAFDKAGNVSKEEREKAAADKLYSHLPEDLAKELRGLWEEFDAMESADSRYANCMDRIQPFLHNTLTSGHTWTLAKVSVADCERRMSPVKKFMPRIWPWVQKCIEQAVRQGWLQK